MLYWKDLFHCNNIDAFFEKDNRGVSENVGGNKCSSLKLLELSVTSSRSFCFSKVLTVEFFNRKKISRSNENLLLLGRQKLRFLEVNCLRSLELCRHSVFWVRISCCAQHFSCPNIFGGVRQSKGQLICLWTLLLFTQPWGTAWSYSGCKKPIFFKKNLLLVVVLANNKKEGFSHFSTYEKKLLRKWAEEERMLLPLFSSKNYVRHHEERGLFQRLPKKRS